jgi:hypothetical protein
MSMATDETHTTTNERILRKRIHRRISAVAKGRGRAMKEQLMNLPHSDALVFFGATGDLIYKKIFPALYAMERRGHLKVG